MILHEILVHAYACIEHFPNFVATESTLHNLFFFTLQPTFFWRRGGGLRGDGTTKGQSKIAVRVGYMEMLGNEGICLLLGMVKTIYKTAEYHLVLYESNKGVSSHFKFDRIVLHV